MAFAFFEENRAGVSPLLNGFIIKTHFTRQCSTLHESFPRKNSHFCELNFEFDIFFGSMNFLWPHGTRTRKGQTGAIIKLAFQTKLEFFTTGANDQ